MTLEATDEPIDETSTSVDVPDEPSDPVHSPDGDEGSEGTSTPEEEDDSPEAVAEREKKARTDARIKAAEAAEKKAAAERKKRLAERETKEREEAIIAREARANALIEQAQHTLKELEERKAAISKGGYDALKALGVDYGDWTKKTLEDTSPDAVAQQAMREAKALRDEIQRRDEAERARQAQAEQAATVKRFEEFAEANAEDFPDASLLPSRVFRVLADEAAREYHAETGRAPTFTALLPRLDKKAKDLHDEQKRKGEKRSRPVTTPSDGDPTPQATPGQSASTPANRTLTPAIAGTRAKPPRQMTEEEIDEWARAELRRAMAEDRKASAR